MKLGPIDTPTIDKITVIGLLIGAVLGMLFSHNFKRWFGSKY